MTYVMYVKILFTCGYMSVTMAGIELWANEQEMLQTTQILSTFSLKPIHTSTYTHIIVLQCSLFKLAYILLEGIFI